MSLIVQTVFANLIDWLFKPLDNLCSQLLTGAFGGLVGSMSNDEWNVAITAANRIGWIMGFVNMALCIIGALQAAAKGSVADVIKSFALAVLAWPLTAVCISVMITMDGIVGQITNRILTIPLAGVGTSDPFGDSVVSNLVGTIVKLTAGFDLIIRIVVYLVLFLAVLALAGMLAARDISLILLACVAPLPVMMTGWKVTRPAAAKWAQAVVGVLLSAPLSALVIMVGSGICYVAKNNPHYAESFFPALMGITTIIMACFSPKLIMPAVSFIGTNVAADMQERGGQVGPNAIKAAVQVTAGVVQAATAGATGGIGKAVNSGAEAVLGAAQGRPPTWEERWAACSTTRTKARIPTRPPVRKMAGKASRRPATMIPCLPPHNRPTLPEPPYRRRRTAWTVPVRARPWTPRPPTRATAVRIRVGTDRHASASDPVRLFVHARRAGSSGRPGRRCACRWRPRRPRRGRRAGKPRRRWWYGSRWRPGRFRRVRWFRRPWRRWRYGRFRKLRSVEPVSGSQWHAVRSDRRLTGVPLSPRVRVDVMPEGIRPSGRKTRAGSLRLFFSD